MRTVVVVFVVAFLGLSAYSFHLSRLPDLECSGSAVTGFIDPSSTQGYPSIRQAVEKYLPESTERTVVARRPEDQRGGTVLRAYDGDELVAVIDVSRTLDDGWLTSRTETC